MILQKAFFRKKKNHIYLFILCILFSTTILINNIKQNYKENYDNIQYEHTSFLLYSKTNQINLINKEKGIESFYRIISLENVENEESSNNEINSILEKELIFHDKKIHAFPDNLKNYCDIDLNDNQTLLMFSKNEENINNLLNKKIVLKNAIKPINLEVIDIKKTKSAPYICIAEELFNELLKSEQDYLYSIKTKKYSNNQKLKEKWSSLDEQGEIDIISSIFLDSNTTEQIRYYESLLNKIDIICKISTIIFIFIIIFVIKELLSEEEQDILILKHIGYNKIQNISNIVKNILLLNLIVYIISFIISTIFTILFGLLTNIPMNMINWQFIFIQLLLLIVVEIIFIFINIKNINH